MNIATKFPLLVVEDDMRAFARMERCLSTHASNRTWSVTIHHANSLVEAKQKFLAYNPFAISTDMNFPKYSNEGRPQAGMGAEFLRWCQRKGEAKCLVYSGSDDVNIKKLLLDMHVYQDESSLPPILKKSFNVSDDAWARTLLDLLLVRS